MRREAETEENKVEAIVASKMCTEKGFIAIIKLGIFVINRKNGFAFIRLTILHT